MISPSVFEARLLASIEAAEGIQLMRFASPPGFSFVPGQFMIFRFTNDPKTTRAYSICSSPAVAKQYFEIVVGDLGPFSQKLVGLLPGKSGLLAVRGPFGHWTYDGKMSHAVLIAGGTGISPMRSMCRFKVDGQLDGRMTVCLSAKTPEKLLFRREYEHWRKSGITVITRVTQPGGDWPGPRGRWNAQTILDVSNDPQADYYICGPQLMVKDLRLEMITRGIDSSKIHIEKWADYAGLI